MVRLWMLTSFVFGLWLAMLSGWHLIHKSPNEVITWLIFNHQEDFAYEKDIYRMRADGSHLQNLTHTLGTDREAQVTSDGKWIVFVKNQSIFRMRTDGSGQQLIYSPKTASDIYLRISLNKNQIVFPAFADNRLDIFRINLYGSDLENLSRTPEINEHDLYFSPDGQWIFYEGINPDTMGRISSDGSKTEILIPFAGRDGFNPQLTPDGQWLVFQMMTIENYRIYRMRLDGSEPELLTPDFLGYQMYPKVTSDGQWILFVEQLNHGASLYRMRLDGSEQSRIFTSPSWIQKDFLISPDNKWVYFVTSSEIYRIHLDGSSLQKLTHNPNGRFFDDLDDLVPLPDYPSHRETILAIGIAMMVGAVLGQWIATKRAETNADIRPTC